MKRRLGLLAASVLVATVGMFAPASPASAHTTVCAGTGVAVVTPGLGLPGVTNTHATFTFNLGVGACADGSGVTASGHVHGACGLSSGEGVTTSGHVFAFASQGTVLVVTGMVTGQVSATEDAFDAGSCANGTATNFNIVGSAALTHPVHSCTQSLTYYPNGLLAAHTWACV